MMWWVGRIEPHEIKYHLVDNEISWITAPIKYLDWDTIMIPIVRTEETSLAKILISTFYFGFWPWAVVDFQCWPSIHFSVHNLYTIINFFCVKICLQSSINKNKLKGCQRIGLRPSHVMNLSRTFIIFKTFIIPLLTSPTLFFRVSASTVMFLFVCLLDKEGMDYVVDNVGVEFDIWYFNLLYEFDIRQCC